MFWHFSFDYGLWLHDMLVPTEIHSILQNEADFLYLPSSLRPSKQSLDFFIFQY